MALMRDSLGEHSEKLAASSNDRPQTTPHTHTGFLLPPSEAGTTKSPISNRASRAWEGKRFLPVEVAGELPNADPEKELKGLLRMGGIPAEQRPSYWFWLSGGHELQSSFPPSYFSGLSASTEAVDETAAMSIEIGCDHLKDSFKHHQLLSGPKAREGAQHADCRWPCASGAAIAWHA